MFVLTQASAGFGQASQPIAHNGVIDLRAWDFSDKNGVIPLQGEWRFAWRQFINPEIPKGENAFSFVDVPHRWRGARFNDGVSDGRGYGTYYLRVLLPDNAPRLALKSPGLTYATATYINGELIRMAGKPGADKAREQPYYIVDAFQLPSSASRGEVLDIVIHISNHIHARGGMIAKIELGSVRDVMTAHKRYQAFVIAMVSAMLAITGYCLVIYCTRRAFKAPLYFALFLFSLAAHIGVSKGVFVEILPFISGLTLLRVEYLAIIFGPFAGYLFIASLYPHIFHKLVTRAITTYTFITAFSVFAMNAYQYSSLVTLYQAGLLLTLLTTIIGLALAAHRRLDDAILLFGGLCISFVALAVGIYAQHLTGAPSWLIVYVSLLTNILAQAITLGRQLTRTMQRTERLGVKLKEANERLEARVTERTRQLDKALEKANLASHAKSEFLAAMSHEIRTPMNGVIGMTEAVLDGNLPVKQRENIQVIRQSAKSLMVILNDILDISKIEAGKMTLETRPFNLQTVIDSTLALWKEPISQKGLALKTQIDGDISGYVLGDEIRLGQVLSNIISNACKFTQKGHINVLVKARDIDAKKQLEFRIEDTGTGIKRESVEQVFKAFAQEDQSISRRHGGTGLGLPICVQLTGLMGGELNYDSGYEDGAAFVLSLTLETAAKPKAITQTEDKTIRQEPRRLKLLIAEDNTINRKVLRALLAKMPFDLSFVHDGFDAVNLAQTAAFDIILMDIQMPNMGGVEATQAIRAGTGPNVSTPVIAVTANAMTGDKEAYMHAGMNGFVSKPINPKDLIEAISQASKSCAKDNNANHIAKTG